VNYQDFCAVLEQALVGHSYEPRVPPRTLLPYGTSDDTPRLSDSAEYLPAAGRRTTHYREYPIDLDEGSAAPHSSAYRPLSPTRTRSPGALRGGTLSPPRPTESLQSLSLKPYGANSGYGTGKFSLAASGSASPDRYRLSESGGWTGGDTPSSSLRRSIPAQRTSPGRVGSRMWGSQTPLSQKGNALKVAGDKWCCAVCLYIENPASASNCAVCDSPNYTVRKVSIGH
jgi:hypothetical protein